MISTKTFDQIYEIMEESFPTTEFGTYSDQKELLKDPTYHLLIEHNDDDKVIAFLASREFETFRFIEHISVAPSFRGGGIGKSLVERFIRQSTLPIVLEIEPPKTEIQQKRVLFYERLGFRLNKFNHIQPPLRGNQDTLLLNIMTYPELLTNSQYEKVKNKLYQEVYKVSTAYPN
ncbi:GNAT family acetyltransferase [Paenibacillus terrae HPL-003]|uniref:GNAT family acetyltransferase n=1 Tax=Paenibacillus terrae (strain HPL-003) TaxID=985665 RepID=G7W0J0_PAETH|nr:GNAT family N-acetyltransferase [Paenibacillus terrae]AET59611.1 GNAT family acetyltransferase [Paenibacillus terrae HPL-003]